MKAWQLFVLLVVLLTSDAAPSKAEVACAYEDETFCRLMRQAYEQANLVEGNLTNVKFKETRKIVSGVERKIEEILNITEKPALLEPLRNALHEANRALFQFKVKCSGKRRGMECKEPIIGVAIMLYDLGKAIMTISTGKRLEAMKKADKVHHDGLVTVGGKSILDLAIPFGYAVLDALEIQQD